MDSNQMNQENQNGNVQEGNAAYTETVYTDLAGNTEQNWQQMPYPQNSAQQQYYYNYQSPAVDTKDGLCVAALVLGIVGFFMNPVYACSILAVIFGVIGIKANGPKNTLAKAGLGLGIGSFVVQFGMDVLITILTFGMGAFSFCC